MNKQQFLNAVRGRLSALAGVSGDDIEISLEYYAELLDDCVEDGMTEEEAVASMGSVDEVVSKIFEELPLPLLYQTPRGDGDAYSSAGLRTRRPVTKKRVIAIVAAAVICFLAFIAWSEGIGYGLIRLTSLRFEPNEYTVSEPFRNIVVRGVECDVVFAASGDDDCSVVCSENSKMHCGLEVAGDTLTVTVEDTRAQRERVELWYMNNGALTVYLPDDTYGTLSVATENGDITLPGNIAFDAAVLSTQNGRVDITGHVGGALSVETVSGDVNIEDAAAGALVIGAGSGNIWLASVRADTLSAGTISGQVLLKDTVIAGEAAITTTSGEISLTRSDARSFYLETVSGFITGSLLTPKSFLADSVTGRVTVPTSVPGSGECVAHAVSGGIHIKLA